jgi:hypothetical protein
MLLDSLVGMNELHQRLKAFLDGPDAVLHLPADCSGTPEPYEELLTEFIIKKESGPICLAFTPERGLQLTGSLENLKTYIEYFHFRSDAEDDHHHPEYVLEGGQPKKGYISAKSLRLIIEVNTDWIIEMKRNGQPVNQGDGE